jgi:phosphate uptake regulator
MYRLLDKGLEQLTSMVFKMGGTAEKVLTMAIGSFLTGRDVSEDVHELSEILVSMTVEVEEKAFELIAINLWLPT